MAIIHLCSTFLILVTTQSTLDYKNTLKRLLECMVILNTIYITSMSSKESQSQQCLWTMERS